MINGHNSLSFRERSMAMSALRSIVHILHLACHPEVARGSRFKERTIKKEGASDVYSGGVISAPSETLRKNTSEKIN